jgi:pyruvate/2-oxoglutarate dehydrogenase complex dihydrolipoamide dehydrogenase (E3) component
VLVSTVELAWRARKAGELGIRGAKGIRLDWRAITARKDRLIASWSKGKAAGLAHQGIAVLRGHARFIGPHEIAVGNGRRVTARRIIIATGATPVRPSIEGVERALTSDQLLARTTLPARLVVIGGGAIGMELGFAFGRAGSRVTILQSGDEVLSTADGEVRKALLELAPDANVEIRTGVRVGRIGPDLTVEAKVRGRSKRFRADVVLVATGRAPNLAGLGLGVAGVALERGAVRVNKFRQSVSAPHVYAAGDATGAHQHTPAAWYEGQLAADNALRGNRRVADFSVFPTATFTIPALAQVGLTEEAARQSGARIAIGRAPFADSSAGAVSAETEGLVKAVLDKSSGRILGVHVLGPRAEDLIHVAAVAMRARLTRDDLAGMHYVFPTLAGSVFDAMWP